MIEERTTTWPEELKALRRRHCFTIAEAARHADISPGTWKSWELTQHLPHEKSAGKVAQAFGLDPESLPRPGRVN